jgi:hyperosmotically inducible protein
MKNLGIRILTLGFLAVPLLACEQPDKGPAERAGERVDEAVEQGKDAVDDAAESAGVKMEEAGDAIREKTDK